MDSVGEEDMYSTEHGWLTFKSRTRRAFLLVSRLRPFFVVNLAILVRNLLQ